MPDDTSIGDGKTTVERDGDCDLVVRRSFNAPARLVFRAWTSPDLFRSWWAPKSFGMTILACEMDVRPGGGYRLEFGHPSTDKTMEFFGRYLDVIPDRRLVWTNEEGDGGAVTTVTFEEDGGQTHLTLRETYPSKQALEEGRGAEAGLPEQFAQLDDLLSTTGGG
jgi:uncharacterized protein YndB with AHSA1/START domain